MLNYPQIDALFGAPLNTVPRPQTPFKMKTVHWVVGGVVLGLMMYGARAIYLDFIVKNEVKVKKRE